MSGQNGRTPAAAIQLVEAMTNPTIARFLVAELAEHRDHTRAQANGSLLVEPRMNVVQQHIAQLCDLHGFDQPAAAPTGSDHHGGQA